MFEILDNPPCYVRQWSGYALISSLFVQGIDVTLYAYIFVHCITQLFMFGFSSLCNYCGINKMKCIYIYI